MAILINMGQRGFVLKEGFVAPGGQIEVNEDTAKKLAGMYPKDFKLVVTEAKVKPSEDQCEGPKIEPKDEKPVVKRGRRKKVQEEVK